MSSDPSARGSPRPSRAPPHSAWLSGLAVALALSAPAAAQLLFPVETQRDVPLAGAGDPVLSPDGRHAYVPARDDQALVLFERRASGALSFVEAYREGWSKNSDAPATLAISADGFHLYAAGYTGERVMLDVFARDPSSGLLTSRQRLDLADAARSLAVSPDGRHLYASFTVWRDGLVIGIRVFERDPATGLLGASRVTYEGEALHDLTPTPGGRHLYATSVTGGIYVFARDHLTGSLSFLERRDEGFSIHPLDRGADDLGLSPDGRHLYAVGFDGHSLVTFERHPIHGTLTFLDATYHDDPGIEGLLGPQSVTVSPEGDHLFVAGELDSSLAVFRRDRDSGAPSFVETHFDGRDGIVRLHSPQAVVASPDGTMVYVTSAKGGYGDFSYGTLAAFRRDPATGALSLLRDQLAAASGVAALNGVDAVTISADGRHVYSAAKNDDAVAIFERDAASGRLTYRGAVFEPIDALKDPLDFVLSPDGRHLYVSSAGQGEHAGGAVTLFARNPTEGTLDLVAVVAPADPATGARSRARTLALSPDGRHLYAALSSGRLTAWKRQSTTGELTWIPDLTGDGEAIRGSRSVRFSPDGETLYLELYASGPSAFHRDPHTGALRFLFSAEYRHASALAASPDGRHLYVADDCGSHRFPVPCFPTVTVLEPDLENGSFRVIEELVGNDPEEPWEVSRSRAGVVSPDGRHLYFGGDGFAVFERDPSSGRLHFRQGLDRGDDPAFDTGFNQLAVSPDSRHVYVAFQGEDALEVFRRGCPSCLVAGRFRVEIRWRDFTGRRGSATPIPALSDSSGLFWFFDEGNWEMLVKVVDGCAVNGHFWVFASAATDVEHTLTVTDGATGETRTWSNPAGRAAPAVTDTRAFTGCPTDPGAS